MKSLIAFSEQNLQIFTHNILSLNNQQIKIQKLLNTYGNYMQDIGTDVKVDIMTSLAHHLQYDGDSDTIHAIIRGNYKSQDPAVLVAVSYMNALNMLHQYGDCDISIAHLILSFQQQIRSLGYQRGIWKYPKHSQVNPYYQLYKTHAHEDGNDHYTIKNICHVYDILYRYHKSQYFLRHNDLCLILLLRFLLIKNRYQFTHLINFEQYIPHITQIFSNGKSGDHERGMSRLSGMSGMSVMPDIHETQHGTKGITNACRLLKSINSSYQYCHKYIECFLENIHSIHQKVKNSIRILRRKFTALDIYLIHHDIDPGIIDKILLKEVHRGNLRVKLRGNHVEYFMCNVDKSYIWGQKMQKVQEIIMAQTEKFTFQEIARICSQVSAVSIRKTLAKCNDLGLIRCVQKGRHAYWIPNKPNGSTQ